MKNRLIGLLAALAGIVTFYQFTVIDDIIDAAIGDTIPQNIQTGYAIAMVLPTLLFALAFLILATVDESKKNKRK